MPVCPTCRSEYVKSVTRCPTCDIDLVEADTLPEQLSDEEIIAQMSEEELASVARGTIEWCREIQNKLLDRGIPAAIRSVQDAVASAGHHLILQVVVRAADGEKVAALFSTELREQLERDGLLGELAAMHEGGKGGEDEDQAEGDEEGEGSLACPACGSTEPLVEGECPDCGLYLGTGDEE